MARLNSRPTAEEIARPLPGDALVPDAATIIMHAITIEAPSHRVWPWLAQMGSGRGGWYSYDFVDNDGHPSSREIIPSLQQIAPGDVLPSLPGTKDSFEVGNVKPEQDLVLTVPAAGGGVAVSWEFFLDKLDHDRTRLLIRGRISGSWPRSFAGGSQSAVGKRPIEFVYALLGRIPRRVMMPIALFGHERMQQRQLRGIKKRAEATMPARGESRPGALGGVLR